MFLSKSLPLSLGLVFFLSQARWTRACQGFTALDAYRNGPYIAFKEFLTKVGGLDFRESFGTFKATQRGMFFFTFISDVPITLRKNRVVVASNYYEGGFLGSSSTVLHLQPGDLVYLYALEGPIKPFFATFSGFLLVSEGCYGGGGGGGGGSFGQDTDGGSHGGGGYHGGRFAGSQPPSPRVDLFARSGRRHSNGTSPDTPTTEKSTNVIENLKEPDEEDKIFELIK